MTKIWRYNDVWKCVLWKTPNRALVAKNLLSVKVQKWGILLQKRSFSLCMSKKSCTFARQMRADGKPTNAAISINH